MAVCRHPKKGRVWREEGWFCMARCPSGKWGKGQFPAQPPTSPRDAGTMLERCQLPGLYVGLVGSTLSVLFLKILTENIFSSRF